MNFFKKIIEKINFKQIQPFKGYKQLDNYYININKLLMLKEEDIS